MIYQKAVPADISRLVEIRRQQLIDEGIKPDTDIDKELTFSISFHPHFQIKTDGKDISPICLHETITGNRELLILYWKNW